MSTRHGHGSSASADLARLDDPEHQLLTGTQHRRLLGWVRRLMTPFAYLLCDTRTSNPRKRAGVLSERLRLSVGNCSYRHLYSSGKF